MAVDVQLYQEVASLKTEINIIRNNDLLHINEAIKTIDERLWSLLIIIVGAILLELISRIYKMKKNNK